MMILPWMQEFARQRVGLLKIALINADKEYFFSGRVNVRSVPTFLFYRDGKKIDTLQGAPPKEQLLAWVDMQLRKGTSRV